MEEVDKIIIESLNNLNCDIEEEVTSLKDFTSDIVVSAISSCLEGINPQIKLSKKLPPSMSARIKFASNLAQQIKDLGFRGDMGYQTILYFNEVEIRRVLMFLLERLPKDSSTVALLEPQGYVPRIVKQIEDNLKLTLSKMWLPSEVLHYGTRVTSQGIIVNTMKNSCPLATINLIVPADETATPEQAKYIPLVTEQCNSRQLIPSLLFEASGCAIKKNWIEDLDKISAFESSSGSIDLLEQIENTSVLLENTSIKESNNVENVAKSKTEDLINKLKEKRRAFMELQEVVSKQEEKLRKLQLERENAQKTLKDAAAKVKVKNKTLAVLSNEENKVKLRNLIQKSENRLSDLANQWNEVQSPLLEEHKTLKNSISSEHLQYNKQNKFQVLKKTFKTLVKDYEEKTALEENLKERCKELNSTSNRAVYTKRILEIVGNIKKQNKEIQKILADTRQVQKDINNLTGQVDRSFTISDETIFRDCKHDEAARKAYKLLAALREECNGILQAVSDMGHAERELRNLEEQIDSEKNKKVQDQLEKVCRDLAEIKKEIDLLK